jgi:hypothetical protein
VYTGAGAAGGQHYHDEDVIDDAGASGGAAVYVKKSGGYVFFVANYTGGSLPCVSKGAGEHTHLPGTHTHLPGTHTHGLGNHTHPLGGHVHGLGSHTHDLNLHTHDLNLHTHPINHQHTFTPNISATYGFYDDTEFPRTISLAIDGVDVTVALGGPWAIPAASVTVEVDITAILLAGTLRQNHTLEFTCTTGQGEIECEVDMLVSIQAIAVV